MAQRILKYRTFQPMYPTQIEKEITGLSAESSFELVGDRILKNEGKSSDIAAQLFLPNGIPLNRNDISGK